MMEFSGSKFLLYAPFQTVKYVLVIDFLFRSNYD